MSYTNDVLDYYGIQKKNDDELMHYAKGQTKKGAKYLRRLFKKGKWIYEYPITGKGYKRIANNLDETKWEIKASSYGSRWEKEAAKNGSLSPMAIKYSHAEKRAKRMSENDIAMKYRLKYGNDTLAGFLEQVLDDVSFDVGYFIQQHRRKKVVNWPDANHRYS